MARQTPLSEAEPNGSRALAPIRALLGAVVCRVPSHSAVSRGRPGEDFRPCKSGVAFRTTEGTTIATVPTGLLPSLTRATPLEVRVRLPATRSCEEDGTNTDPPPAVWLCVRTTSSPWDGVRVSSELAAPPRSALGTAGAEGFNACAWLPQGMLLSSAHDIHACLLVRMAATPQDIFLRRAQEFS